MNLLSSLLKYTADQIAALRAKDTSQDTTVSGINSRLTTAEGDIDSLEAQFTTVVSAVTTDTEVTNIRVGDDGVTYDTAGNAVRKQFSDLKSALSNGNFNQKVKINPFVTAISHVIGTVRGNRGSADASNPNYLKIIRDTSSPTAVTYGCYFAVEPTSVGANSGHKIYINIKGLDDSGTSASTKKWRIYGSSNGTTQGIPQTEFTDAEYENIFTLTADVGQFNLILVTSSAVSSGAYFTVDSVQWIDLTETFGAGYEPTMEQFKAIYDSFPYSFVVPTAPTDLREVKTLLEPLSEEYIFPEYLWNQMAITSSNGGISASDQERSMLRLPIPDFITTIECASVSSVLFADDGGTYVGEWNGNSFVKAFSNFTYVNMAELRERFPTYDFYVLVYAYPNNANNVITFRTLGNESHIKTVKSKINTLSKYTESYYNIANSLVDSLGYASNTGLFAENIADAELNMNCIQCSELVYAALRKILYGNSRYVKDINYSNPYYWETDGSVADVDYMPTPYIMADYLRADQMAKYFDGKGTLIKFDANHTNIQPGDLVFKGFSESDPNFKHITHVAIVASYNRLDNMIFVVDGSTKKNEGVIDETVGVNYSAIVPNDFTYYVKLNDVVEENNDYCDIAEITIDSHTVPPYEEGVTVIVPRTSCMAKSSFRGYATAFIQCDNISNDINFLVQFNEFTGVNEIRQAHCGASGTSTIIPFAVPSLPSGNWSITIGCKNYGESEITLENIRIKIVSGFHDKIV